MRGTGPAVTADHSDDHTAEAEDGDGARPFLRRILAEGAQRLGATLDGDPVFGWCDHTIGAPALKDGARRWLRATGELEEWAGEDAWTGNQDAGSLTGIPRPLVIGRVDWKEPPVAIYAELMTYVSDPVCSPTPELREPFHADGFWWSALRRAVDTLAVQPTGRSQHGPGRTPRLEDFYGHPISPREPVLATEHTDLHWGNLTHPGLNILDWEYWGAAPAGYGAASLYAYSLLVPETAAKVHEVFADLLHAPAGRYAQLAVISVMLNRIDTGDYPDLKGPLRDLADRLLADMPARR
jgi:hypothetical protein